MPNMKGGEVFDRLKEINPEVIVLLSSGYSIDGEASKILERGCSGFIQKPFDMNQLSQSIGALLKKNSN
jgi:DNA-binding NtrC family response regulator